MMPEATRQNRPQRVIGLVGNPNCGKTTLFNALTGARQRVGNWPGVTVEKKSGHFTHQACTVEVVDLPGTYSLDGLDGSSLDEQVARRFVLAQEADLIVNIVDAANLERNLYLTTQLLEMQVPLVVVLNMMDVAEAKGVRIDTAALAAALGCPVLSLVASRHQGIETLKDFLVQQAEFGVPTARPEYPAAFQHAVAALAADLPPEACQGAEPVWVATKALEGDELACRLLGEAARTRLEALRLEIEDATGDEPDIVAADARYAFIARVAAACVTRRDRLTRTLSDRIDKVVLNRLLGIPIFLLMMYLMFLFTINLGGVFTDFFAGLAKTVFVDGFGQLLAAAGAPSWLEVLLAQGVGGGLETVASFIPVIGFLFIFLSMLEDSGYMARAAFVMDRCMRLIGLPGKSFVPLIVGFGCNVPAVMACRTLEGERDRLMTMAMTPFMSCGARLPVYALFAAVFFPAGGQNMVFLLYLIGIAAAVLTGLALKRTLLHGQSTPFVMELPPYHLPTLKSVLIHTASRLNGFMFKAGKVIVPMVLVLNLLNAAGTDGRFDHADRGDSLLAAIGRQITPLFAPIGLEKDNWPAAVGIFTGVLAKEAVVGTLNALYAQLAAREAETAPAEAAFDFFGALQAAAATIPEKLTELADRLLDPLGFDIIAADDSRSVADEPALAGAASGAMIHLFGSSAAAFAYQVLILLYFPCVAVLGAIHREAGAKWAAFVALWSAGFGYAAALACYQFLTFAAHPLTSLAWLMLVLGAASLALLAMRRHGQRQLALRALGEAA